VLKTSWIADTGDSYDRVAHRYSDLVQPGLQARPLENRLVDHFALQVTTVGGGPVLDLGCGPGWLTTSLASRGLNVTGIDISIRMLHLARANTPELAFAAASITQIPIADSAAAGVFCWYVLHHVPDEHLGTAIGELARVTRPGGFLMLGGTLETTSTSRLRDMADSPCGCSSHAAARRSMGAACARLVSSSTPPSP
jgi:ubiquinone/menaquinone biosynthesis C-methylase UbiE